MVCLRNISVHTLHKGNTDDNNNIINIIIIFSSSSSSIIIIIIIIIIENMLSLALFSKKGIDDSLSNYRRISVLSTSSKIPEFVINKHFPHYLMPKLNTCQHGSMKCKSTATNRVTYPDFITPLLYCQ
jgi:nitrogen fixation/metabolism regulation signal transduction histidine kinase